MATYTIVGIELVTNNMVSFYKHKLQSQVIQLKWSKIEFNYKIPTKNAFGCHICHIWYFILISPLIPSTGSTAAQKQQINSVQVFAQGAHVRFDK